MMEDDEDEYIDLYFNGDTMMITEVEQHKKNSTF
jgi:hypothetical protein